MERNAGRRLSGRILSRTLLAAALGLSLAGTPAPRARASAGPAQQTGVFALLGGTPKIVSKFWGEQGSGPKSTIYVQQFPIGSSTPILTYDEVMQATIHMIVIRDDFATFAHVHPAFNTQTGAFSQAFTKDPAHAYYVFADTTPHGLGQQVFRFTMGSDIPQTAMRPYFPPSPPTVTAGAYTVTLGATTLAANQEQTVDITVDKGGKPAGDLGVYLGAPAHCVLINTSTLTYVHVHPTLIQETGSGGMVAMNEAGPRMKMHLPALPGGVYKLWIEFRGAEYKLYTAPFTLAVK